MRGACRRGRRMKWTRMRVRGMLIYSGMEIPAGLRSGGAGEQLEGKEGQARIMRRK